MLIHLSGEGTVPERDGRRWPFAFATVSGDVILADTVTEIVAELLDDYDPDDAASALTRRFDALAHTATNLQAVTFAAAREERDADDAGLDVDQLNAVLADKRFPPDWTGPWTGAIPLYLVATHFEPYTTVQAPTGDQVLLLDPYSERSFLDALCAAGVALLMEGE